MIDPYNVLGLDRGASHGDVKKAYRGIIRSLHTNEKQSVADHKRFALVNAAYNHIVYGKEFVQPEETTATAASAGSEQSDWPRGLLYDIETLAWAAVKYRDSVHQAFTTYRTANDANMVMLMKAHSALSESIHRLDMDLYPAMTGVIEQLIASKFVLSASFVFAMGEAVKSQGLGADDRLWLAEDAFTDYEKQRPLIKQALLDSLEKARSEYDTVIRGLRT